MEQVRKRHHERGFSEFEPLIISGIILVIIVVLLPKFGGDQMNSRELAVQLELRTINTAQVQYRSRFGKFASTLAQLGPPAAGVPGPAAADLILSSLASGEKEQYRFVMTATPVGYTLTAKPKFYNNSGRRSYYTNQTMAVRSSTSAEGANANSPEVK